MSPFDQMAARFTIPASVAIVILPPVEALAVEDEPAPPPTAPRRPPGFVEGCVVVVADADGYTDRAMRDDPYMWTWIGAETWYYVRDFQLPIEPPAKTMKTKFTKTRPDHGQHITPPADVDAKFKDAFLVRG